MLRVAMGVRHRQRRFVAARVLFCLVVLIPLSAYPATDPAPSPLFDQSLQKSIERMEPQLAADLPPIASPDLRLQVLSDSTVRCIYELVCASGNPDTLAELGLVVGIRRRGGQCADEYRDCIRHWESGVGSVCLIWQWIGCDTVSLPAIPLFGWLRCVCDLYSTMAGTATCYNYPTCRTPTCEGMLSCPGQWTPTMACGGPTCLGAFSCNPGSPTCHDVSCADGPPQTCHMVTCNQTCSGATCTGQSTCVGTTTCGAVATCSLNSTCPPEATCAGVSTCEQTCTGQATCSSATCGSQYTCQHFPTCGGGYSCDETPTCGYRPTCPGGLTTCSTSETCPGAPATMGCSSATCAPNHTCYGGTCPPELTCIPVATCPASAQTCSGITCGSEVTCSGQPTCDVQPGCSLCSCPQQGDFNDNGVRDIIDLWHMVNYVFLTNRPAPQDSTCYHTDRADLNCDGHHSIIDVVFWIDETWHGIDCICDPCTQLPFRH